MKTATATATATASALAPQPASSAGGRLVALDGRALPLLSTRLTATAAGGLCRVVLEQRFKNSHAEPLHVGYRFPLPHDGAVSGFAFRLGDRRIVGEVDKLASARERFEEALVEGRTAALLEQVRGSVFSQELGNVPPGAEVVAELTIDQRLAWLPEGAWEWRFPTALAPRYQGTEGRVPDAGKLETAVADGELPARLQLSLAVSDQLAAEGRLSSPTHALQLRSEGGASHAGLQAEGGAPLDRDVAIRWPVATAEVGVALDVGRPGPTSRLAGRAFGLLSVVPPTPEALKALPRDLIVLLDTSGSMSGRPLDQARAVVAALVGSLTEADTLELIEFSNAPRRWRSKPVAASGKARTQALAWLAALNAGGSTEMTEALYEALTGLRDEAQRQVVLVTDGEIGFEAEIVEAIMAKLTAGSRLHTVGVGSSVNRSLTGPAARAGRGVEVVLDLEEPADAAAARLLQRTVAPAVTELKVSGSALVGCATKRLPDLFGGAPALLSLELAPTGGTLTVTGQSAAGKFERTVTVGAANDAAANDEAVGQAAPGNGAISALFAREAVEELELLRAAAGGKERLHDLAIERLGLEFQISTRRTSWVAISDEATVDPRRPTRRETMPQQLPYGMSVEGLGLRQSAPCTVFSRAVRCSPSRPSPVEMDEMKDDSVGVYQARSLGSIEDDLPPAELRSVRPAPSSGGGKRKGSSPPPKPKSALPPKETVEIYKKYGLVFQIKAKVKLQRKDSLVIEIEVERDSLAWSPGGAALAHFPTGRGELDRVGHQVEQELPDPIAIHREDHGRRGNLGEDRDAVGLRQDVRGLTRLAHQLAKIAVGHGQGGAAFIGPGEHEQAVDQLAHSVDLFQRFVEGLETLSGHLRMGQRPLDPRAKHHQRGLELVARFGDEALLGRETLLQAGEHPVGRLRQPGQLVAARGVHGQSTVKALAVGDRGQLVDRRLERFEAGPGQPGPDQDRHQQQHRRHIDHGAEQVGRPEEHFVERRPDQEGVKLRVGLGHGRAVVAQRRPTVEDRRGPPLGPGAGLPSQPVQPPERCAVENA